MNNAAQGNQAKDTRGFSSMRYGVFIFLFIIHHVTVIITEAQTFSNQTIKLPNIGFYTWLQKGISDMNNDGLDDIVRADTQGNFFILKQQSDGSFREQSLGKIQFRSPLSVILGDVDNNGYTDILTGGQYNGVHVVKANADGSTYTAIRLEKDSIYTQASALADIDNDGFLDAFVCNDDSTNGIWRNNNGDFVRDMMGFDFGTVPLNRHSGNYGIVFTDFDNDGDIDAYLSKCSRLAPKDSSDQRRINQLFQNSPPFGGGAGGGVLRRGVVGMVYQDVAKSVGLADSSQTWVTEFQDIDNDGDMDAFIANHYTKSRLMLNDGTGHFREITATSGLLGTVPDGILQALMRDFDNDGYVDLLVSGMMGAKFFKNNGNRTFSSVDMPFLKVDNDKLLRSFVLGDLNHDGFLDLYTSYYWGAEVPDRLWLNNKNSNHYLGFRLIGTQSNRSAVGSRITLKAGGQTQIREVRAGESYGISNSLTQIIGLGSNTNIESVEIKWASGQRTTLQNPTADQFLTITEPICQAKCLPIVITRMRK